MLVRVEVAVATQRPPRHDRTSQVLVEAATELEAGLIAMAMASGHCEVIMPVSCVITDILAI
jgi:hypothetical protein